MCQEGLTPHPRGGIYAGHLPATMHGMSLGQAPESQVTEEAHWGVSVAGSLGM